MRGSPESSSGYPIRVSNSTWLRLVRTTSDKYSSSLIPDEVEHVIGKGRDHEMRASYSSSTKTYFKWLNVADENNKGDFRTNGDVLSLVIKVLLRNRE